MAKSTRHLVNFRDALRRHQMAKRMEVGDLLRCLGDVREDEAVMAMGNSCHDMQSGHRARA